MVNGLNSNYTNYLKQSTGIESNEVQARLQSSKEAVVDNISSNSVAQTIGATSGNGFAQAAPLVPFLYVADKFVDSTMSGNVNKNLLSTVANFGDKIYQAFHLDKIMSGQKISKFNQFLQNNTFTKYFTDAYKAIPKTSMARTTTLAQNLAPKVESQASKILPELVNLKYTDQLQQLATSGKLAQTTLSFFENIGPLKGRLTPEFLDKVVKSLDNVSNIATQDGETIKLLKEAINQFLQKSDDISEKKLSETIAQYFSQFQGGKYQGQSVYLSKNTKDVLSSIVTNNQATTDKILDVVDDLTSNRVSVKGQVDLTAARNKLTAATSKIGKTPLGKLFAKGTVKAKDVATYGGGIISLIFMASSLMNAVKATKEAPKGEKKATFMHVLSEQYLGMILFQPSINLVYKAAGNKYRGMTTEGRKALADLVKNTNLDENLTKEGLKIAKMQQKLLLKGVDKDKVAQLAGKSIVDAKNLAKSLKGEGAKLKFWEKPLKAAGSVLGAGLDTLKRGKFITLFGKKMKVPHPTLKGFAGGFGRLMLIMMVVQPFIQKPLTKLCHKIFGKPTTYLAKQDEMNNPSPKPQNNDTNLIKQYTNQNPIIEPDIVPDYTQQQIPQYNPNMIENPNAAAGLQGQGINQEGTYIPSIAVQYSQEDSSMIDARAESIIKSTDKYLKNAKKYI